MTIFHVSWVVLYVVGMNQHKTLRDKSGITASPIPTSGFVEEAVNVPLGIGDHLAGKTAGDEPLPRNLARDVRRMLDKGPDTLRGDEAAWLIEEGNY